MEFIILLISIFNAMVNIGIIFYLMKNTYNIPVRKEKIKTSESIKDEITGVDVMLLNNQNKEVDKQLNQWSNQFDKQEQSEDLNINMQRYFENLKVKQRSKDNTSEPVNNNLTNISSSINDFYK